MFRPRLLFPAALVLSVLLCAGQARAQTTTIDYFNFNETNGASLLDRSGGVSGHSTTSLTPSFQPTTATVDGYSYDAIGGTTVNSNNDPTGGGGDLLLSTGKSGANDGKYLTLKTSTAGYQSLTLSFATRGSGSGFGINSPNNVLQFSFDDITYQNIGSYVPRTSGSGYNPQSFNLTGAGGLGPATLNNASTLYLRIIFNGASSSSTSSDNNKIDNLYLTGTATPAPAGIVSMGIGLGMAGLGAWRRRRQARQKAAVSSLQE